MCRAKPICRRRPRRASAWPMTSCSPASSPSRWCPASGLTPIVVGTHALLQPDVGFRDLALVVIDEQHRFGVAQRLTLSEKGTDTDTLYMSATPIPRTLMLTLYGDLDVSRLTEKPPGRLPVDTRAVPLERIEEVVAAVLRALERQAKVYSI